MGNTIEQMTTKMLITGIISPTKTMKSIFLPEKSPLMDFYPLIP